MTTRASLHGLWSSQFTFVLAVTGSAVGLGNIWKFPYIAGSNGGGAFVAVYLVCVAVIGLPIMMSEVLIGRRGRRNPVATMLLVGEEEAGQRWWRWVGAIGVVAGMLILSFYSVVAGWSVAYVFKTANGELAGHTDGEITAVFDNLVASWPLLFGWHTLFMLMTIAVVARGVQRGLEQAVRILMPALLILLITLLVYAMRHGEFAAGLTFMFRFDFDALTAESVLVALGHAFFTLSIGMGAVMAYGAYLPEGTSVGTTSLAVVIADTSIALLAGMVIFPIVFAHGMDPAEGKGLLFHSLPIAFGNMTGGAFFGTLFFILLTFAAWTSSIGLIEPAVAWAVETRDVSRAVAAWTIGGIVWLLGLGTVFSFNVLADVNFWHGTFFENIDHLATNVLLPLGGLLISVFAGWVMCRNSTAEELDIGTGYLYRGWRLLARWIAPAGVLFIFMYSSGLLGWLRGLNA